VVAHADVLADHVVVDDAVVVLVVDQRPGLEAHEDAVAPGRAPGAHVRAASLGVLGEGVGGREREGELGEAIAEVANFHVVTLPLLPLSSGNDQILSQINFFSAKWQRVSIKPRTFRYICFRLI